MSELNVIKDLTIGNFMPVWIKNMIENCQNRHAQDMRQMQAFLDAEDFVVCGSGPSLMTDLPRMKQRQETYAKASRKDDAKRTIILANHSNLATLLYYGVVPDIVVVTDSQDVTVQRIERDVLPDFKGHLKHQHTVFVLPTSCNPALVKLCEKHHLPLYFFNFLVRQAGPADTLPAIYNAAAEAAAGSRFNVCILHAGCVSNASVLVCNALKLVDKAPRMKRVLLSGVDFSYPNGVTRCANVTRNPETKEYDVVEKPTFLGPELLRVKLNGLDTSEDQYAYYQDLRFIYKNMILAPKEAKQPYPFDLYTTSPNFIHDFLPVDFI